MTRHELQLRGIQPELFLHDDIPDLGFPSMETYKEPDICRNNHGGNPESEQANLAVNKEKWQEAVYQFALAQGERGITADEAQVHFDVGPNTVAPRLTELKKAGRLERLVKDGKNVCRKTRAGVGAGVYVAIQNPHK